MWNSQILISKSNKIADNFKIIKIKRNGNHGNHHGTRLADDNDVIAAILFLKIKGSKVRF